MKLYSKEELKSGRIFFDKKPPKFGLVFTIFTSLLMVAALLASTVLQKTYIVKAQGVLKSSDLEYVSSNVNGVVIEILKHEGDKVKQGDVIMMVSDGQETLQEESLVKQLSLLKQKIRVMDKYQSSLDQSKNLMKNEGIEQEYYAYLEYYLGEKENSDYTKTKELESLRKKEKELATMNDEHIQLKQKIEKLNNENNENKLKKYKQQIKENEVMLLELQQEDQNKASVHQQILKLNENQKMLTQKVNHVQGKITLELDCKNELDNLTNKITTSQEDIAQLKEQIENPGNNKNSMHAQMLMELGKNRTQVESSINEIEANIKASADQSDTYKIKANQSGIIHYLNPVYTGVSIQKNQVVAEVSTSNPRTIIAEAYVQAHDISKIKAMQEVKVAIDGVNSTKYGTLKGQLVAIDAGTITQETPNGNALLYRIKVALKETKLHSKEDVVEGIPSMPIEARIIYEKETYFDWLMEKLNFKN